MILVKVDIPAVEVEIRFGGLWHRHCENMVRKGLDYAQNIAPVDTGEYRASLFGSVTSATSVVAIPGTSAITIGDTCDHWVEVEFQEPMRYLTLLRTFDYLKAEG